ncbi:MAG: hypothetical protein K6E64_05105 [Lachnospiraceae bacterium]|nr:hypothetical protein [Lachnospiraceae bacterium]
MGYNDILRKDPMELFCWLNQEFSVSVPAEIISAKDMDDAAKLLLKLTSYYSYLCSLLSYAKVLTRQVKRDCDKATYEDMIDRRDMIEAMQKNVMQQYSAISRAVTIHIENNRELRMNATGGI